MKEKGVCSCACLCGCRAVTAVTQPRSRSGEDDGKGRVGERRGENIGVRRWGKSGQGT